MIKQTTGAFYGMQLNGSVSGAVTILVDNRDVLAEISLVEWSVHEDNPLFLKELKSAIVGIKQVVTQSGEVENFDPLFPAAIYREGVVTITFFVFVRHCHAQARWNIFFWS